MKDKVIFLAGINGLRAISAIAVVISHIALAFSKFDSNFRLFGTDAHGNPNAYLLGSYGVTIFFVLSGFLITYLLLIENEKQPINIKSFYFRRILRIWPLYYFYMTIALLTVYLVNDSIVSIKTLFFVLFFSANISSLLGHNLPFMDHLWSVSVEEQFYLFWPILIQKTKKHLVAILIAVVIIFNIVRVLIWYYAPYTTLAFFSIANRFDCMMIGGIGAIYYLQKNKVFFRIFDNKISQFVALFILLLLAINQFHINAVVDTFIISIVALTIIIGQINLKNRLVNFNNRIFDFLGKISFGIYIYHPLIIFYMSKLFAYLPINGLSRVFLIYLSVLAVTVLTAYLSYTYIESYFIRIKQKFATVKTVTQRTD